VDHQIPLEVCPTSNVQTKAVADYASHPLRLYVARSVPVTINTDNRLFSRTTMTEELWRIHRYSGLNVQQLREVVLNGFRYAFLHWEEKQDLLHNVEATLERLLTGQLQPSLAQ
jgi:adenosine deaminase